MIQFKCQCGQVLKVKDEGAGKRVRCPGCKQVVQVPTKAEEAAAAGDPSGHVVDRPPDDVDFGLRDYGQDQDKEAEPIKHCPGCHVALPQSAIICTTCGYDFRTGKTYEAPKTLVQKVPWKLIAKWVIQIAMLALVAGLAWFAYQKLRQDKGGEQPADEGKEVGGTSRELEKRQRYRKYSIRVTTRTSYLEPRLPQGLSLTAADGTYTPDKALKLLRARLASEARGRLKVAGHTVVEPGARSDLKLRLDLTVGWVFADRGGKLVPSRPYVAKCDAAILRGADEVVWPEKAGSATYEAKRLGPEPAADAVAGLTEAATDLKLDEATRQDAEAATGKALGVVPPPSFLAKLIAKHERGADGG